VVLFVLPARVISLANAKVAELSVSSKAMNGKVGGFIKNTLNDKMSLERL